MATAIGKTGVRRVDVGGFRLEYAEWPGKEPAILLLHEALGSVSHWRNFPEELAGATGRRVIAWSRYGHGRSDKPAHPRDRGFFRVEAMATLKIMDCFGLARAVLFGHSDGTAIALIAAAEAPERISALILEAPHVTVEQQAVEAIAAVDAPDRRDDLKKRLARHHDDPDHVFESWTRLWLDPEFGSWSIEPGLPAVTAPVLLVQGRQDPYFSLDQLDRIENNVSSNVVHRCLLDECGHSPHREYAQTVTHAVDRFLKGPVAEAGNGHGGA